MSPQCLPTTLTFLAIAVPLTVLCWGGFWRWRWRWSALGWDPGEWRLFRWTLIWVPLVLVELALLVCVAAAGGPARCTTKWDEGLQRWRTECTDGARAITKWDAGLQRYRTDVTKAPKGDKAPRGWPAPGKALPQ